MNDALYARLLPVFVSEAEHKLDVMDQALTRLTSDEADTGTWRELGRAAHTIKGNAAMLGLRELMTEADRVESWAAHAPHLSPGFLAALHDARMTMRRLLDEIANDAATLEAS